MLRHHNVLINDARRDYPNDEISKFQLLSRSTRTAEQRISGTGGDVRFISYELLRTYSLLFLRNVTNPKGYYHREAKVWSLQYFFKAERTSRESATTERVGLQTLNDDRCSGFRQLLDVLSSPDSNHDEPQSSDFKIFRTRLEALNRRLNSWKPSTFGEFIRYRGWVEEEANIWSTTWTVFAAIFIIPSLITGIISAYYTMHPVR